jgi:hypothetical protein
LWRAGASPALCACITCARTRTCTHAHTDLITPQAHIASSAERQAILSAAHGMQTCLFVFGAQNTSSNRGQAAAAPVSLLEGIVVLTG